MSEQGSSAVSTGRTWVLTAAAWVVILAACGGDVMAPPPEAGVDFDLLFAPATAAEIQAVRSEWSGRSPTAVDAEVEASITTTFGGMPGQANVISHRVDGFTHYGAVFIPDGVPAGAPLVAFLHASGDGVSIPQPDTDFLFGGLGDLAGNAIYAVPSYRSEELRVGGQTFRSGGGESPWDRDVDDALAFIDAALQLTPQADPGRISAVGVSRGALVALLMAVRDPRIETVVELAGPTDFFGGYVRELLQEAADGRPRDLVGIGYMNARFLQPWLRGEVATSVFRMELVRRSAVLFAPDLPDLQLHHGTNDAVVRVSQAESLIAAMQGIGRSPPAFESFLYSGAGHSITSMAAAPGRVRSFFENTWPPSPSSSSFADLGILVVGVSSAAVGDTIRYTLTTTNDGPLASENVRVSANVPAAATAIHASRGAGLSGGLVTWPPINTLAQGAVQVDTLVIVASSVGLLTNSVSVSGITADPDLADNSASITTTIGVASLSALFATPSGSEIQAVRAEWAARNPSSMNATIVQTIQTTASGVPGVVAAISHTVDGFTHYGAVFVPNGLAAGTAPIIMYLHPGDGGVSAPGSDLTSIVSSLKGLSRDFVYVLPSFRSESLKMGGTTYLSGGPPSPWDRDVDDALALMEVVMAIVPQADPSRVAAIGYSRGAEVALLMGIRDARIDAVVEFSGPTDWYDPWVQGIIAGLVAGQPANRAGLDVINQRFIQPWAKGQVTLSAMRRELIRRSPVLFASSLPWTQVHHGTADATVNVSQAQSLIARMNALGRSPPVFEGFLYSGGTHNLPTLTGSTQRMRTLVESLWP